MQAWILGSLALIIMLLTGAVLLWRRHGWRQRKQTIVMLIVLAAALQLVNLVLISGTSHAAA